MAENAPEGKERGMKSMMSLGKKKASFQSSPKKLSLGSEASSTSESSLLVKRQSEFERISKAPRYQNTYRLDSKFPFRADEVKQILKLVVDREAADFPQYDTNVFSKLALNIAGEVRTSVRHLNYDRYKICVIVYIGENKLQGFQAAFRALWDADRDSWATYYYHTRNYFISCTCFGLYHD